MDNTVSRKALGNSTSSRKVAVTNPSLEEAAVENIILEKAKNLRKVCGKLEPLICWSKQIMINCCRGIVHISGSGFSLVENVIKNHH